MKGSESDPQHQEKMNKSHSNSRSIKVYRFNTISDKNPNDILCRTRNQLSNLDENVRPQIDKEILTRRSNAGGIRILNLRFFYRALVTWAACYRHKSRHVQKKWNRTEDPAKTHTVTTTSLFTEPSKIYTTENVFDKWSWENGVPTWRRIKLHPPHSAQISV